MKKFTLLFCAAAVAFSAALTSRAQVITRYWPDPVFDAGRIKALHDGVPSKPAATPKKARKILVFSRTCGFRHYGGIVAAKEVFKNMGEKLGVWEAVISDDVNEFTPENLKKYDAVVLNNPTAACFGPTNLEMTKMKPEEAKAAVEKSRQYVKNLVDFVNNGGGVLGLHSSPDCYNYDNIRDWRYTNLIGGEFIGHPWGYGSWGGVSYPKYMYRIDDEKSPITKGIWPTNGFMFADEVYMMGKSFDRTKCRVLVSLDVEQSYVPSEKVRLDGLWVRQDKDIPVIWIKKEGKGRVAYTSIGHDWNNYPNPKYQEMLMRLAQFAIGDLEADTTPLPQNHKRAIGAMEEAPTLEQLSALASTNYGEKDKEINEIIFGVFANSFDKDYCEKVEKFVYDQISKKIGTEFYRSFMAEMLWATGFSSKTSCKKFEKLAKKVEFDGIRSRIENAIDHFKHKQNVPYAKERKYKLPKELPEGYKAQARLMKFLADNPDVDIPEYLNFGALDAGGKARLIYTIASRNGDLSEALKLQPESAEMTIALALAAAQSGSAKDIDNILKGAKYLSGGNIENAASYIVSIKSPDVAKVLLEKINKADNAETALISACLVKMNLDSMVKEIFAGYESKSPELRAATMKTATSIANAEVFSTVAKVIATENDKKTKAEAIKALMRTAQACFEAEMFNDVEAAYAKADAATRKMLLRLVRYASSDKAAKLCEDAYSKGLKTEAIKALGEFDNGLAFEPLVKIAKAGDEREKTIAQIAIVDVANRCGFDNATADYIVQNAVRQEEKDKAVEIMVKKPTPYCIKLLKKMGRNAEAEKAQAAIEKIKTKYLCSEGNINFKEALDKNVKTRWSTNVPIRKKQWFAIDFGYAQTVGEIDFDLGTSQNDFPSEFKVMAGPSVATAKEVDALVFKDGSVLKVAFEKPITAQVFKILVTADKTAYWWSIHELEIKEEFDASKLQGKPQFFFNNVGIDFTNALDGSEGSRWTSGNFIHKGASFAVDFRKKTEVSKLVFNLGNSVNDFPPQFKIYAGSSANNAVETAFKAQKNGDVLEVVFPRALNIRYLKVVSDSDTKSWWSIHEFSWK